MCTTKVSPTAVTGSPVADISMPELSIVTWPSGSLSTRKIAAGSALMVRCISMRSSVMVRSLPQPRPRDQGREHMAFARGVASSPWVHDHVDAEGGVRWRRVGTGNVHVGLHTVAVDLALIPTRSVTGSSGPGLDEASTGPCAEAARQVRAGVTPRSCREELQLLRCGLVVGDDVALSRSVPLAGRYGCRPSRRYGVGGEAPLHRRPRLGAPPTPEHATRDEEHADHRAHPQPAPRSRRSRRDRALGHHRRHDLAPPVQPPFTGTS